jgi:phosphoribosyl-ATP pyrophosphohydrolase/phosphoribosyl-AMP cyclohydrolase
MSFLAELEQIIQDRYAHPVAGSYTNKLFEKGLARIAQKVGEEGVEVVVAAALQDNPHLVSESADLLYHLLVLLTAKGLTLADIEAELARRHTPKSD